MNKSTTIQRIQKYLNNRRVVYFQKYINPVKQQYIIDAELHLSVIKGLDENRFNLAIKQFAEKYVRPLLPGKQSPFYQSFQSLYNDLK